MSCLSVCAGVGAQPAAPLAHRPGPATRGETLLPNGWRIAPAGQALSVGDLPLSMLESPDGRYLVVANNGYLKPSLTVVDLQKSYVRSKFSLDNAWLGLAWHPDGKRLYCSGAAALTVAELPFTKGRLTAGRSFSLGKPDKETFIGGLAVAPDGKQLYAVNVLGQALYALDTESGQVVRTVALPAEPYTLLVSPDGKTLFVSLWGGAKVLFHDAGTLEKLGEVSVGEHPNAMVLSLDGARLFVACANTNSVWAVDVAARKAVEQISIALYPKVPNGSTPNALGLSPDGKRLLVANADNNTVAVVDVAVGGQSRVAGFVPTGWYPTAAQFTGDGKRILVLSGKGLTSQPNPRGPQPGIPAADGQFIGALLQGSLSIVPAPDSSGLAAMTKTVYRLTPLSEKTVLAPARAPAGSPIPARVGGRSPIRHVFYVIRENRTYDQILGDLPEGNGDPNLCLFGEEVTPNAHALARQFVLLDNFYVDAEVSYDGHAFSTGAYATDAVEKIWPMNYGGRGGRYQSEGDGAMRNAYGNLDAPEQGYLWDACNRAKVSVRSYGEFVNAPKQGSETSATEPSEQETKRELTGPFQASVPGLEGHICPDYPPFELSIPDNRRIDIWLKEFRQFEQDGKLPALSVIRLGGDHTSGAKAGFPTPRAMIAENDLALGRLVEAISKSRYWAESAIFVLEDDAQNGPDHVDAHRSVALVLSPYTKRHAVDSTLYTTSGMLRTMELILGLPPMSQYDAAAAPFYKAFQTKADPAPFAHLEAQISLDEMNDPAAPAAKASAAMNLDEADRAPEIALNEILWKSVRGEGSPMPPPVHAAFVRPVGKSDE
jgi:YVTN family beta-propeller protein